MAGRRDPAREWREQYARSCLNLDFEPLPGTPFHASVQPLFQALPTVRTALSPGFVFRDLDLVRDVPRPYRCRFQDPELDLATVAHSLRISTRYLQRLLERSGTSFTARVTELRLQHALALPSGPGAPRISEVALDAGLSDISHFNRLFRSRFGDPPRGVRAHGRKAA